MPTKKLPIALQFSMYWLMMLTGIFIISVLLQWVGISISPFHLPISLLFSGLLCWSVSVFDKKRLSLSVLLLTIVFLLGAVIGFGDFVSLVSDYSTLGRGTYSDGILALTNGWNPIFDGQKKLSDVVYHSTRATWYLNSILIAFLGHYEMSKQLTLLFAMPTFVLTWHSFAEFAQRRGWLPMALALLSVCSPVALSQVFNFYDDAVMAYVIQCFLLLACYLLKEGYLHNELLMVLAFLWIFLFHLPQGGCRVALIVAGSFLLAVAFLYKRVTLQWVAARFLGVFIFCVGVIGYQPMIQSLLKGENIFSFYLQNALYKSQQAIPMVLQGKSSVVQGLLSLVATPNETERLLYNPYEKLLGILSPSSVAPDMPLQGFGALSALLFLLAIVALLYFAVLWKPPVTAEVPEVSAEEEAVTEKQVQSSAPEAYFYVREQLWWMIGTIFLVVLLTGHWWLARSIAIAWFLIPLSMVVLIGQERKFCQSLLKGFFLLASINVLLFACVTFPKAISYSNDINAFWERMAQEELPTLEDGQTFNVYSEQFPSWTALKRSGKEPWVDTAMTEKMRKQLLARRDVQK